MSVELCDCNACNGNLTEVTECACCYVVEPCYFDGEAWICLDYRKCKENQANG